jgi:septal ring factor EnvC (AmiA/AmiB activator)
MKDNLDEIFKKLEHQFDIEEPTIGHFNRFEAKLNQPKRSNKRFKLFSYVAVAASIVLLFGIWLGASFSNTGLELASISSEMEETQNYFLTTIENELSTIENKRNSDTEQLINDALKQLEKLEIQYNTLTLELKESNEDKRIIYAMISNFQQRIDILQNLLQQIETVKQLKTQNDEKYV